MTRDDGFALMEELADAGYSVQLHVHPTSQKYKRRGPSSEIVSVYLSNGPMEVASLDEALKIAGNHGVHLHFVMGNLQFLPHEPLVAKA